MVPIWTVIFGALIIGILSIIIYRIHFHPLSSIPGPLFAKISGFYAAYHAYRGDNHHNLYSLHRKHGPIVRYGPNKVSFNSTAAIKEIYSTTRPLRKVAGYRALILKGNAYSTFTAIDKTLHGRKRRILAYGFSEVALKSYEAIIQERIGTFCSVLTQGANKEGWGRAKNMSKLCAGLTFDVMAALVFGRPFNILEDEIGLSYIIDAINTGGKSAGVLLQLSSIGKFEFLYQIRSFFRLLFLSFADIVKIKRFLTLSAQMAKERAEREPVAEPGDDARTKRIPNKDIFSYILNAKDPETGEPFTSEELWGEARVLIVAGSDTTSTAMSAALYYLTRNRNTLAKLRNELKSRFTSEHGIRLGPQLNSCVYLKHVIEEALRMSPPVGSALWRETTTDYVIEGRALPQGTEVGVPIYAIHHNEKYFPNPHVFDPDRWDESIVGAQAAAEAKSAWLAFQTGSRGCIGRPLAMMELTLALARVIYSYEIKIEESEREVGECSVLSDTKEFATIDQLTSSTIGPFLRFRRSHSY